MKYLYIFRLTIVAFLFVIPTSHHAASVEVSWGELLDKITILELKQEHFTEQTKLHNVRNELAVLLPTLDTLLKEFPELQDLMAQLKTINAQLWQIEDAIRLKEALQEFDFAFIKLARQVYLANDTRGHIKRKINEVTHSYLIEEKSYTPYQKVDTLADF